MCLRKYMKWFSTFMFHYFPTAFWEIKSVFDKNSILLKSPLLFSEIISEKYNRTINIGHSCSESKYSHNCRISSCLNPIRHFYESSTSLRPKMNRSNSSCIWEPRNDLFKRLNGKHATKQIIQPLVLILIKFDMINVMTDRWIEGAIIFMKRRQTRIG